MARPIDEKIVRMTLDNASFKDRVTETLKSFTTINQATRDASAMDISNIAKGIAAIEGRFSAAGVVVASVLKSMTDSAIVMGKQLYSAMVDPLVEGGKKRALNIEQAKFQFQGLGMDVDKTMASALEAVKGTAFGLDEAAVVASQFGATGMRAGDEMTEALRGISGVAAMTGSSYSDIGNVFTTVAGNGRLMGNDLLRLGSRGVNAAATLAKAMNTTEEEVRKMVTAGEISFEMFAGAMSDAFGEHATRANETYAGSLSNLNAALSRIGAEIYTPRFEQLRNIFNALTPVVDDLADAIMPLIDAFNEFSGKTSERMISAIEKIDFKKFAELGGVENIVASFWNILQSGSSIIGAMSEGFGRIFPKVTIERLVALTDGLKRLTSNLVFSTETTDKFARIFEGVFSLFSTGYEIVKTLAQAIFGIIPEGTGGGILDFLVLLADMAIALNESVKEGNFLTDAIKNLGKMLGSVVDWLKTPIKHLRNFASAIRENIGPAITWLQDLLAPVGEWFKEAFSGFGTDELLGGGFLVGAILLFKKISEFFTTVGGSLEGLTSSIKGVFGELGGALQSFQEQVKYKNLLMIAISIGVLAISLKLLEGMSIGEVAKGIAALVGSMAVLAGGMLALSKINIAGGIRSSVTIVALAAAVTIMATALKMISDLNPKELITGLVGLAGIITTLSVAIIAMSKFGGKIGTSSLSLIALASAVTILASAVKKMSAIDTGALFISVAALGVIFAEIALFMIIVKGSKIGPGTGLALLGVAAAIQVIVSAISKIAKIDTVNLVKGLVTIGIILTEIALFGKLAGGPRILAAGAGILVIATALSALMIPVTTMGKMTWEQLAKGLGGMAVALVAVGIAGAAASGSLLGAAGILVMAAAMNALMPPILIFSTMSWGAMLKGFVGLAGGMTVLAVASMLLSPAILPMLGFGAALLVISAAVAVAGIGIAAFGVGMTALAAMTATSVSAILSAMGMFISGMGGLIVGIVKFTVELGMALIGGLNELVPKLITTLGNIIVTLIQTLAGRTKEFVVAGYDIVIAIMEGIRDKFPELAMVGLETLEAIITGMADALEQNGQEIVTAIMRLMGEVIIIVLEAGVQMIDALFGWIPGIKKVTSKIGETAEEYIRDNFGADQIGRDKLDEFNNSINSRLYSVEETGFNIGNALQTSTGSLKLGPTGYDIMGGFNTALDSRIYKVEETGYNIADTLETTTGSADLKPVGYDYTDDLILGANSNLDRIKTTGVNFADTLETNTASADFKPVGQKYTNDLISGANSNIDKVQAMGTLVGTSSKNGASKVSLVQTGAAAAIGFTKGVGSKSVDAKKQGVKVANSSRSGASSISLKSVGGTLGSQFSSGLSQRSVVSKNAGRAIANAGKVGAGGVGMSAVGKNFGTSFANGISKASSTVISKAKSLASSAANTVKNWLGIASPSKLLTSYGDNFGLSFANAIGGRVKTVGAKAKEMAITASTALRDSLEDIKPEDEEIRLRVVIDGDEFDPDNFDIDPVDIRPNPRYTNGLVANADDTVRQNRNNNNVDPTPDTVINNEYNYEIGVTAGGNMSRAEVKKLAKDVQTEIKNENDRGKIGRGEAVIF